MRGHETFAFASAFLLGLASSGTGQTPSQLGAWDALMLSPFGALPPRVLSSDTSNHRQSEILLRYGRWEYDSDDAVHNNFGLTVARRLPFGNTAIALTGAYLSLQCGGCSNWAIGGLEVQSTVWRQMFRRARGAPVTATVGIQSSVGGARNSGSERSHTSAIAVAAPIGLGFAIGRYSYLDAAVFPGFGYGRIAGVDRVNAGTRPSFGAAAAWRFSSGLGVELGVQKIFVDGGPSQLGVGLSWGLGRRDRGPP